MNFNTSGSKENQREWSPLGAADFFVIIVVVGGRTSAGPKYELNSPEGEQNEMNGWID